MNKLKLQSENTMLLYYDNKSTTNIAHHPTHHGRTKHIEVDQHFIKEKLEEGLTWMPYIKSSRLLADFLIKGLPRVNFEGLSSKLGMIEIHAPTWGGMSKNPNL